MPRFNFNNLTLQSNADITKVMENFNEIEQKAVINTDLATTSQNGLMSSSDKTKLNGIEAGANKIYVDKSISKANMNPVMSNTIYYALLDKVDKVNGKQLSTNDYTNTEKEKLARIAEGATNVIVDDELSDVSQNAIQNSTVTMALGEKVDKEEGKGLSTNDYTTQEKNKLASIDTDLLALKNNEIQENLNSERLQGYLANDFIRMIKKCYPVSKYWTPSIVHGEEPEFHTNIIPTLTGNTDSNDFKVYADYSGLNNPPTSDAYLLFDSNYSGRGITVSLNNKSNYIIVEFATPIKVKKLKIAGMTSSNLFTPVMMYGSLDNANWQTIDYISMAKSDNAREYEKVVDSNIFYKYIKFDKESNSNGTPKIIKINIDADQADTTSSANYMDLDFGGCFTAYEVGQKVSIKVPVGIIAGLDNKLSYDGLGYKLIDESLSNIAFINLVYDGTKFVLDKDYIGNL